MLLLYKHLPEGSSCLKDISKVSINESLRRLERDGLTWKTISGGNIEKSPRLSEGVTKDVNKLGYNTNN